MSDDIKNNLLSSSAWLRILLMVIYSVFAWVTGFVIIFLIIVQALCNLLTGKNNQQVQDVSNVAIDYFSQILAFMTYCSEDKPAPFSSFNEKNQEDKPETSEKTRPEASAENSTPNAPSDPDDVFADISFTAQDDIDDSEDEPEPKGSV